jgi:hypothetical protein
VLTLVISVWLISISALQGLRHASMLVLQRRTLLDLACPVWSTSASHRAVACWHRRTAVPALTARSVPLLSSCAFCGHLRVASTRANGQKQGAPDCDKSWQLKQLLGSLSATACRPSPPRHRRRCQWSRTPQLSKISGWQMMQAATSSKQPRQGRRLSHLQSQLHPRSCPPMAATATS